MRKPILSLAVVALALAACASSSSSSGYVQPPDPQHHGSTAAPPPRPAASPYGGVTYVDPGTNPTTDTNEDRVSTFAMDVDTASYTIAQRYADDGNLPDPASVRVEEWVNAFDQGYRPPTDATFAVHVDGAPAPVVGGTDLLLRIGIQARESSERQRPDAALTFVIDTSGSMARDDRLELVKDSLRKLVKALGRGDSIAVVAFGDDARVVLPPTRATDEKTILAAIDDLQPGGSTNLEAGLRLGYGLARETLLGDGIDRVILASDGVANVGLTDADGILGQIRQDASAGIQLVAIGVGMGNYNDALLEQLADQGDGFYAYVDTIDEARRLFVQDLTSTLDTVALDAKVQVDFDPAVVDTYRLIGFEDRAVADNQFRDGRVAAGAIGAGHEVTALYALRLGREARDADRDASQAGRLATVTVRWTDPSTKRSSETSLDVDGRDLAASFRDTDPHFKLDAVVAAAAETFRDSPWIDGYRIQDVAEQANEIANQLPQTDQVRDFLDLLQRAARLDG